MEKRQHQVRALPLGLAAIVSAAALVYFVYAASALVLALAAGAFSLLWLWSAYANRRETRRLQALADARAGDTICHFARSFDTRNTDTWVIRAVHEELQLLLAPCVAFPIRASDVLLDELRIDSDDLEDLIVDVAERTGRSLDRAEHNPFFGKVRTVRDLVSFVDAQAPA